MRFHDVDIQWGNHDISWMGAATGNEACVCNVLRIAISYNSFDVLVTRNLTWNLRHPKKAYARWTRVLKKGGLLLNFDAGWYRYLYDADAKKGHLQDRVNIAYSNVGDETEGTDVAAMESIARKAPLSARKRPEWDLDILRELGMEALADTEIWKQVWTREERINNASTPMFLIEARKEQRHWR